MRKVLFESSRGGNVRGHFVSNGSGHTDTCSLRRGQSGLRYRSVGWGFFLGRRPSEKRCVPDRGCVQEYWSDEINDGAAHC